MADYQQNQQSCEYLASFGIEPHRVPLDGWDETGYTRCAGDGPMGDSSRPERRPWPDGFDYRKLLALWAADEPSRRPWADS